MRVVDIVLTISSDYAKYPGPRHASDGPNSGEKFRDDVLVPALRRAQNEGSRLIVSLDGARGFTASFLEEAFGGLVRLKGFTQDQLSKILEVRATDKRVDYWRDRISQYIAVATPASGNVD